MIDCKSCVNYTNPHCVPPLTSLCKLYKPDPLAELVAWLDILDKQKGTGDERFDAGMNSMIAHMRLKLHTMRRGSAELLTNKPDPLAQLEQLIKKELLIAEQMGTPTIPILKLIESWIVDLQRGAGR